MRDGHLTSTKLRALRNARATPNSPGGIAIEKREAAQRHRESLYIPSRERIERRRILVYDDVCTTGSQLDATAGYLTGAAGAKEVEGIVLARAPWRTS